MAKATRCSRCGRENEAGSAFCLDCGQSLRAGPAGDPTCPSCGAGIRPGMQFCGRCGKPVAADPRAAAPSSGKPAAAARPAAGEPAARPQPAAMEPPTFPQPAAARSAAARHGALRLSVIRPDGAPAAFFALDREETVCGRTQGEIRITDDPAVSPRHLRFTLRGGVLRAEDLGSLNGTFIRLRAPRSIGVGDEIRVGRQVLRLEPLPPAAGADHGVRVWGAPDPGCRYRLAQILDGGGPGELFPLRPGENGIGRDAGEVAFSSDRYVSARHARIHVGGDDVTLSDAGSSNGTFVRIAGTVELAPGDQLLVGSQLLRIEGVP
jgi:pSer/pThr/pTyr-binding forkhead associated (FHA) protein